LFIFIIYFFTFIKNNIDAAHFENKNYRINTQNYEETTIEIDTKSLPEDHSDFVQSVAHCYSLLKNHLVALKYFLKSVRYQNELFNFEVFTTV
jgi:hypothetical protein